MTVLQLVVHLALVLLMVGRQRGPYACIVFTAKVRRSQAVLVQLKSRLVPQAAYGAVEALLKFVLWQVCIQLFQRGERS